MSLLPALARTCGVRSMALVGTGRPHEALGAPALPPATAAPLPCPPAPAFEKPAPLGSSPPAVPGAPPVSAPPEPESGPFVEPAVPPEQAPVAATMNAKARWVSRRLKPQVRDSNILELESHRHAVDARATTSRTPPCGTHMPLRETLLSKAWMRARRSPLAKLCSVSDRPRSGKRSRCLSAASPGR
jgi:hypothetical protein